MNFDHDPMFNGLPTHEGLWVDKDDVPWVAGENDEGVWIRRLWDAHLLVSGIMLLQEADIEGFAPFTQVTVTADMTRPVTPCSTGLYADNQNDIWAMNDQNVLQKVSHNNQWLLEGPELSANNATQYSWFPTVIQPIVEPIPWKPIITSSDHTTVLGRTVTFPPIQSFGRLEQDKWLALKNLEESAELVEASKRWLKTGSDNDRQDMLSELADVLQTVANLTVAFHITDQELKQAMDACLERNRAKGRL